jgi:type II secretory pathway component PulF
MMIVVVPKLLEIFDGKGDLPASTQALIAVSDFFVYYWYLLLLAVIVIIA